MIFIVFQIFPKAENIFIEKLRNKPIKLQITADTSVTAQPTLFSDYYMLSSNKAESSSIRSKAKNPGNQPPLLPSYFANPT